MKNQKIEITLDQVDNTNGHELTVFAAELLREINDSVNGGDV